MVVEIKFRVRQLYATYNAADSAFVFQEYFGELTIYAIVGYHIAFEQTLNLTKKMPFFKRKSLKPIYGKNFYLKKALKKYLKNIKEKVLKKILNIFH